MLSMVFPVVMYGCASWTIKKAEHRRIDAFELWCWRRLLRVPWTARRSNQSTKGNQSWIFIGRTDVEAETPILWPSDAKHWLIWKDPNAGKDWGQEEKGMTEDEMVGWHHQLDGHEFEWTPGVGDGQRGLACCSPWGHKESEMAERLNWTELNQFDWPLERVLDKQKWVLYPCPGMVTSKLCGHFLLILCWFLCILNSLAMQ